MTLPRIPMPRWLSSSSVPFTVVVILVITVVFHLFGVVLIFVNKPLLEWWIQEDGVVRHVGLLRERTVRVVGSGSKRL